MRSLRELQARARSMERTSMKARAVIAAASLALAGAGVGGATLLGTSAGAATLSCPNFNDTDVPTPPAGQTGYLFIGTSVSTSSSTITVTFHVDSGADQQVMVAGEQQGNGAFHYIVNLPQGAIVTSATVTGAVDNTVVTVSGCRNGSPLPPTTTTGVTPIVPGGTNVPSGPTVEAGGATRPAAATAVQGAARFTG
jgi:hypothetical protein